MLAGSLHSHISYLDEGKKEAKDVGRADETKRVSREGRRTRTRRNNWTAAELVKTWKTQLLICFHLLLIKGVKLVRSKRGRRWKIIRTEKTITSESNFYNLQASYENFQAVSRSRLWLPVIYRICRVGHVPGSGRTQAHAQKKVVRGWWWSRLDLQPWIKLIL